MRKASVPLTVGNSFRKQKDSARRISEVFPVEKVRDHQIFLPAEGVHTFTHSFPVRFGYSSVCNVY